MTSKEKAERILRAIAAYQCGDFTNPDAAAMNERLIELRGWRAGDQCAVPVLNVQVEIVTAILEES